MIQVDTPYLTGRVEALCMENPVYDWVIGNIEGVRSVENPDLKWVPIHNSAERLMQKSYVVLKHVHNVRRIIRKTLCIFRT